MGSMRAPSATNHQDSAGVWTEEEMRSPGLASEGVPYVGRQVG